MSLPTDILGGTADSFSVNVNDTSIDNLNIAVISFCLLLSVIYHVYFYSFVLKHDPRVQLSINIVSGMNWVLKHSIKGDSPTVTLAVQTIR
jgi:hypothetical protein